MMPSDRLIAGFITQSHRVDGDFSNLEAKIAAVEKLVAG
jgi:hypothetical protein